MFAFKSRPVRNWKILESSEMRIVMRRVTSIKDITGNNSHLRKARQTVEMPGQVVQFCGHVHRYPLDARLLAISSIWRHDSFCDRITHRTRLLDTSLDEPLTTVMVTGNKMCM